MPDPDSCAMASWIHTICRATPGSHEFMQCVAQALVLYDRCGFPPARDLMIARAPTSPPNQPAGPSSWKRRARRSTPHRFVYAGTSDREPRPEEDATFLFGPNATLQLGAHRFDLYNLHYVKSNAYGIVDQTIAATAAVRAAGMSVRR